ncbi:39629_t:CDS:2, partial [Gigaspora margarita]
DASYYQEYYMLRLYTIKIDGKKSIVNIKINNLFFDIKLKNPMENTIESYVEEFDPDSYEILKYQPFDSTEKHDFIRLYFMTNQKYLTIAYEKTMIPATYLQRKMYCGVVHESTVELDKPKLLIKGLKLVKRNVSEFYKTVAEELIWSSLGYENNQIIYDPTTNKRVKQCDFFEYEKRKELGDEGKGGNKMVILFVTCMSDKHKTIIEHGCFFYMITSKPNFKSISEKMFPIDYFLSHKKDKDNEKGLRIDIIHYFKSLRNICASLLRCDEKRAEQTIKEIFDTNEMKKQYRITDFYQKTSEKRKMIEQNEEKMINHNFMNNFFELKMLLYLSNEILWLIFKNLPNQKTQLILGKTCKTLYSNYKAVINDPLDYTFVECNPYNIFNTNPITYNFKRIDMSFNMKKKKLTDDPPCGMVIFEKENQRCETCKQHQTLCENKFPCKYCNKKNIEYTWWNRDKLYLKHINDFEDLGKRICEKYKKRRFCCTTSIVNNNSCGIETCMKANLPEKINRIRRLLAWYRANNPSLSAPPTTWNIGDPVPGGVVTAQTVLATQRPIWVRIFENLGITNPDPNDNKTISSMFFTTMETVSKEIKGIGMTTVAGTRDEVIGSFGIGDTLSKEEGETYKFPWEIDDNVNKAISSSKSTKELIKKLAKDDPDYLVQNFQNIQSIANIIYIPNTPKKIFKHKKVETSPENSENEEKKISNKKAKTFNVEQNDTKDDENVALLKMFSEQMKSNSTNSKS